MSYGYFDRQRSTYQILQSANLTTPVVAGNSIEYPKIFNGISVRYACGNASLKEEIVLSQIGRTGLPDPARYGLSRTSSYFVVAMEFLLTPNNINAFARRQGAKTPIKQGNDFNFDGDEPIEFEDEHTTLHFFFPKDYAHAVADSITDFTNRLSIKRVFYSQDGKHYMLVGVPLNWINSTPNGDLIIDPTTTVIGNDDVYLQDATNFGTNTSLVIGKSSGTNKKRTIIRFNIGTVPSNATVLNAQLKLRYYGTSGTPWIDRWVQAHQLLVNWDEAQATRDVRLTSTTWAASYGAINGTDAKATMESTLLFKINEYPNWKSWDLTSLTQQWVNLTASNYGVILWTTNEDTDGMNLFFRSSEYTTDPTMQPKLEIIWSQLPRTVYFLKDHLGSIRATVQDTSTAPVVGYDDYDPWGYTLAGRSLISSGWGSPAGIMKNKFTGKEWDDEFGVNWLNLGARLYDPQIGRFFIVDPLWYKYPSLSPYGYAANNPIIYYDPDGRSIWTKIVKAAVKLYKTGDAASAFADNISDFKTLVNPAASPLERVIAGASLASELSPVSVGDVKDVGKVVSGVIKNIDPKTLRFSQRTAGGRGRAEKLRASMQEKGYSGDPIDVVKTDKGLVTIDNTRPAIAQELGIKEIPANVHSLNDPLPEDMIGRFGDAKTWGEALQYRTANQRPSLPTTGTTERPKMPKPNNEN